MLLKDMGLVPDHRAIDAQGACHNSKKITITQEIRRHLAILMKSRRDISTVRYQRHQRTSLPLQMLKKDGPALKPIKIKYEALQKQLEQSEEPQISTTDPDARSLLVQGQV